jgi:hypothetical protein
LSLERSTLRQIATIDDYRNKSTLHCLAAIAANEGTVPPYGILVNGVTNLHDTGNASSTTAWTRALNGFATEALGLTLSRDWEVQWNVDPVGESSKLDALRCACRWVVCGPEIACRDCPHLLADPAVIYSPQEPCFGVEGRLRRLPPGWVHVGKLKDVPLCAAYKEHCDGTWVWVMPEDTWCLAEFTLILHDIATIDLEAVYSQPLLVTITTQSPVKVNSAAPNPKTDGKLSPLTPPPSTQLTGIATLEYRVIRPEKLLYIQDALDKAATTQGPLDITIEQWREYTYAYNGTRTLAKNAGGAQPPGGSAAALYQNMTPASRNPASGSAQLVSPRSLTPQELDDIRNLLKSRPKLLPPVP